MKAVALGYTAAVNDQLYVGVVFIDVNGAIVDEQNLGLGAVAITTGLSDVASAAQTAVLNYSTSKSYGMIASDIYNLPSTNVGMT